MELNMALSDMDTKINEAKMHIKAAITILDTLTEERVKLPPRRKVFFLDSTDDDLSDEDTKCTVFKVHASQPCQWKVTQKKSRVELGSLNNQ
ncbi:hypothetical protein HCN44_006045 [Aphidius gifuensis]|uniref:Uncharacterized protein n=1 Tax=Aphidius gifuensis TaxID=684658 RepID=A0A835CVQ0_APHGI|nr:hypothetical protein HCN44_006045 [Aphidius gifuensis]